MHEVIAILTIQAENDTVDLMVEPLSEKIFTMRNKNTSSGINGCAIFAVMIIVVSIVEVSTINSGNW